MRSEAGEKRRLGLAHHVTCHAGHHVVEPPVIEVALDAGASGPRHDTVDDVELAVLGAAELVLAPVEPAVEERPVEVELDRVVRNDHGARLHQALVNRGGRTVRIRALAVDEDPDFDALGQLVPQDRCQLVTDAPLGPAVHQDVDRRPGVADVVEDAREELVAVRPRLDRRRRARRVLEVDIAWPR